MFPALRTAVSSVTYSEASSNADWERLRPTITHVWLNEAHHLKDLMQILRREYGLITTEKTCRTRLRRWGLHTYKKSEYQANQGGPSEPPRKRKSHWLRSQAILRHYASIPSLSSGTLLRPFAYRVPELVLYSIDRFVNSVFGDSTVRFKYKDLLRPKVVDDFSFSWHRVADLYESSEGYFRGGCLKKFVNRIKDAHLELRLLLRDSTDKPKEVQEMHHHVMVVRFWRVCHKLVKLDQIWPQYQFSFVLDFLIEFQQLAYKFFGKLHPLVQLLSVLSRASKGEIQLLLTHGVNRCVGVMAPTLKSSHNRIVLYYWTDFTYSA